MTNRRRPTQRAKGRDAQRRLHPLPRHRNHQRPRPLLPPPRDHSANTLAGQVITEEASVVYQPPCADPLAPPDFSPDFLPDFSHLGLWPAVCNIFEADALTPKAGPAPAPFLWAASPAVQASPALTSTATCPPASPKPPALSKRQRKRRSTVARLRQKLHASQVFLARKTARVFELRREVRQLRVEVQRLKKLHAKKKQPVS